VKVYVVYREFQADTPEMLMVFTSKDAAEHYAQEMREGDAAEGLRVEHLNADADWEVDINVEETELWEGA
jgi:hypothetical protein